MFVCGQEHDNGVCTKAPEAAPTCGRCGCTATYQGCPVYLKIKAPVKSQPNKTAETEEPKCEGQHQIVTRAFNVTLDGPYTQATHIQSQNNASLAQTRLEQLFGRICGQFEIY